MPPTDYIAMISNVELSRRLREYGVNVGPIVQTTRGVYERRLWRLETGQEIRPRYEEVPDDDDDEEDEGEREEIPVHMSMRTRNEPRHRVPTEVVEEMSSRTQRQTHAAPLVKKEEQKAKGFPLWTGLFFLLLLIAVGYLVVKNMEPEAQSNIPSQIEAEV